MADIISNEELLDRYGALCAQADRHAGDGWRSDHEDGIKRGLSIRADQLDRFADMAIGGIGFERSQDYQGAPVATSGPVSRVPAFTEEQTGAYVSMLRRGIHAAIAELRREPSATAEEWLKTVRIDGVVGGATVTVTLMGQQVPVSLHTVRVGLRALRLRRMVGAIPRAVMEIGGGHGRFVRDVLMLAPSTRVVYCDLTFNLLLAARYLTRVFGDDVHLAWDDAVPVPADARIVLLPPWRIAEIPFPVEVCCNFLSFHHMEQGNVRYYADRLAEIDVAAIYHHNRLEPLYAREARLDDGGFGPGWRSVARATRSTSLAGLKSGGHREVVVYEELLAHERHADRYAAAYREHAAYEQGLDRSGQGAT